MKTYWINITNDCNLRCTYCYQPNKNKDKLTIHNAKKIIEQIKMTEENGKIIFFGGEPLLNFEIIRFIINKLDKIENKRFEYSFTTNLTLLTDEFLQYIVEKNIQVMISCDGKEDTYNKNRINKIDNTNFFEIVHKNIVKFKNKEYKRITISKVISSNNYQNLYEDTMFLLKFKYPVHFNFDISIEDWNSNGIEREIFGEQLKQLVDYYIKTYNQNLTLIANFFEKFKSLFRCIEDIEMRTSCNNKTDMIYSFDVAGNVSPCHFLNEVFEDMIDDIKCGGISELESNVVSNNIYNELTKDEIYKLINQEVKYKNCNQCKYNYLCLSIMMDKVKNYCFLMKFKLRKNIISTKGTFCLDKFMFNYIYQNIHLGRIKIDDFTE